MTHMLHFLQVVCFPLGYVASGRVRGHRQERGEGAEKADITNRLGCWKPKVSPRVEQSQIIVGVAGERLTVMGNIQKPHLNFTAAGHAIQLLPA